MQRHRIKKALTLVPIAELSPFLNEGELVAFDIGPDKLMYLAIALQPIDYRGESAGGATIARTTPQLPQDHRLISLRDGVAEWDLTVRNERFNIHHIQPLPEGEILLACARSYYRSPTDYDLNGRIYASDGSFSRAILLGDGIISLQVTKDGVIWAGYFDEGVFGNYGWHDPVGAAGLVAWDRDGEKHYEFAPNGRLDRICDCYALNVASRTDVWICYYTEFPLVRLHRNEIAGNWDVPITGSHAFAVDNDRVLFSGGYDDRHSYFLIGLHERRRTEEIAEIELRDPQGCKIIADAVVGRGTALYVLRGTELFCVEAAAAAA